MRVSKVALWPIELCDVHRKSLDPPACQNLAKALRSRTEVLAQVGPRSDRRRWFRPSLPLAPPRSIFTDLAGVPQPSSSRPSAPRIAFSCSGMGLGAFSPTPRRRRGTRPPHGSVGCYDQEGPYRSHCEGAATTDCRLQEVRSSAAGRSMGWLIEGIATSRRGRECGT